MPTDAQTLLQAHCLHLPPPYALASEHILHALQKWQLNAKLPQHKWYTGPSTCALCNFANGGCSRCPLPHYSEDSCRVGSPYYIALAAGDPHLLLADLANAYFQARKDEAIAQGAQT